MNSFLNLFSCSEVKAVRGLLSSELGVLEAGAGPSVFFIFLALGPEEGLSEYLVQKTQAGQS